MPSFLDLLDAFTLFVEPQGARHHVGQSDYLRVVSWSTTGGISDVEFEVGRKKVASGKNGSFNISTPGENVVEWKARSNGIGRLKVMVDNILVLQYSNHRQSANST